MTLGLKRHVISLPDFIARLQANTLEWFPGKPFSVDNYKSLKMDSICAGNQHEPTSMDMVVPAYLGKAGKQSEYDAMRKFARRL